MHTVIKLILNARKLLTTKYLKPTLIHRSKKDGDMSILPELCIAGIK